MDTVIIATAFDLFSYVEKRNIPIINYTYTLNDKEYIDDFGRPLAIMSSTMP